MIGSRCARLSEGRYPLIRQSANGVGGRDGRDRAIPGAIAHCNNVQRLTATGQDQLTDNGAAPDYDHLGLSSFHWTGRGVSPGIGWT